MQDRIRREKRNLSLRFFKEMHSILSTMDLTAAQAMSRAPEAIFSHLFEQLEHWLARRWVVVTINAVLLVLLTYNAAQWTWRLLTPPTTDKGHVPILNENAGDYD